MNRKLYLHVALLLLLLFGAACTAPTVEPGAPSGDETSTPEGAEQVAAEALPAARLALASFLDITPDAVELDKIEDAEWSNACLGLPGPDELCAEVITPGYLITFTVDGSSYAVRTDLEGGEVRVEAAAAQPDGEERPAAVSAAIEALANQLGIAAETIEVLSFAETEWSDSCLGLGGPAESCAAVITPGWEVMLDVDGQAYEVRTTAGGEQVRIAGETTEEEQPDAVMAAVEALARQLEIPTDAIEVFSFTEIEWSDSCLGLGGAAESCLTVITPGWEIILGVDDQVYEVRTDLSGERVRIAGEITGQPGTASEPDLRGAVIFFQRSGGIAGEVTTIRIYENGSVERSLEDGAVELILGDPAAVQTLLDELASAGYFDLGRSYLPENSCCDRFLYLMSVEGEEGQHTVEAVADTEDAPASLWKSIDVIESFIDNATATS